MADVHAQDAARPAGDAGAGHGGVRVPGAGEYGELRPLLHPYVHFTDGAVSLRGRTKVLDHLREKSARPPTSVEIRDGQIYRWTR